MEYEKIKQLIEDMGNSKLEKLDIDFPDGTKISMTKEKKQDKVVIQNETVIEKIEESTKIESQEIEGNIVKSPMVGTFYLKPSPTSNPYVEVGKDIKTGDTLCIIEAMKLMNEIESEFAGKITKIFVKDGETVEYGTKLFEIK